MNDKKQESEKILTLRAVKNSVFFIDEFLEETNYKINRELAEINLFVEKNNTLIDQYKKDRLQHKNVKKTKIELLHEKAIRIYDQNFIVADKKIALMEIHLKEIYKKIETLGKAITNLSDVLISEDTKKEKR